MSRLLLAVLFVAAPAAAQNISPVTPPGYLAVSRMEVPVVTTDVTDRPYRVVGEVTATAHKLAVFSKRPSDAKLAEKLWENAQRLGADAVVNATFGPLEQGGPTHSQRKATGQAVKFLSEDEARRWREAQH